MSLFTRKRQLAVQAFELLRADQWWSQIDPWCGLVTLNYHRFGDPTQSAVDTGVYSATAESFEAQIRYLKKHCDLIGLADLPDVLHKGSSRRAVLLTIDDGYRDNYEVAYPILKQHQVPAVIFLATGFLDQPRVAWWDEISWMVRQTRVEAARLPDRWKVQPLQLSSANRAAVLSCLLNLVKTLAPKDMAQLLNDLAESLQTGRAPVTDQTAPWMTWEMVREMRQNGIAFGGHTVTHPILAFCSAEQQRSEIFGCKARIEQELGETVEAFTYPVGMRNSFNSQTIDLVQEAGYRWAFGFYSGYTVPTCNPYDLRRVAIHPEIEDAEFRKIVRIPRLFAR